MDLIQDILGAATRIGPFARKTTMSYSPSFSELVNAEVYFKLESQQVTGSFKVRGALNKILGLTDSQKKQGVFSASTGNHGAAVSLGMKILGINGSIIVPENIAPNKVENIKNLGGNVEYHGNDCLEAEQRAQEISSETGATYISPYNDPVIVAGQGTMGVELDEDLSNIDTVIVAVGGGGLISGIGGYLKTVQPKVEIIGCSPKNSCVMYKSLQAGTMNRVEQ